MSRGIDLATKKPVLFIPAIIPIVLEAIFVLLTYLIFPRGGLGLTLFSTVATLIVGVIGFLIAETIEVDMAYDVIYQRPVNLRKSFNMVTKRLVDFLITAVISAICIITVILIPIAFFIVTIMIVDGTNAIESTKRSLDFVLKNLGSVLTLLIIAWVIYIVCAIIPYVGGILRWVFGVIITVSTVLFYVYKRATPTATQIPTYRCPTCGTTLQWIQQYQRWYCPKCKRYL